jgi:hypothetical protein
MYVLTFKGLLDTLSSFYLFISLCNVICKCNNLQSDYELTGPFEKFVDWWQCAAVMQREAVTRQVAVMGIT